MKSSTLPQSLTQEKFAKASLHVIATRGQRNTEVEEDGEKIAVVSTNAVLCSSIRAKASLALVGTGEIVWVWRLSCKHIVRRLYSASQMQ